MILHKILEASGLREGHEYVLQHTVTAADEDALQRPDAVIISPDGKQVVVDSKVSNTRRGRITARPTTHRVKRSWRSTSRRCAPTSANCRRGTIRGRRT